MKLDWNHSRDLIAEITRTVDARRQYSNHLAKLLSIGTAWWGDLKEIELGLELVCIDKAREQYKAHTTVSIFLEDIADQFDEYSRQLDPRHPTVDLTRRTIDALRALSETDLEIELGFNRPLTEGYSLCDYRIRMP